MLGLPIRRCGVITRSCPHALWRRLKLFGARFRQAEIRAISRCSLRKRSWRVFIHPPPPRALQDFNHRAHGGIPDKIPALTLRGAPLAIGILLKQAGLTPSSSEALRCVEQGGVRMDGVRIRDKALKVAAGTYVVQVGKRRFARVLIT